MHRSPLIGIALLATGSSSAVLAHQPIISDGTAVSAETAIPLEDIQISRVIYHEVTEDAPQVWLTFEVVEPQFLGLSLGIPEIDRLADFRPAVLVLAREGNPWGVESPLR